MGVLDLASSTSESAPTSSTSTSRNGHEDPAAVLLQEQVRPGREDDAHGGACMQPASTSRGSSGRRFGGWAQHVPRARDTHIRSPAGYLTRLLRNAYDAPQLLTLLELHDGQLNAINVAAAVVRAAHLASGSGDEGLCADGSAPNARPQGNQQWAPAHREEQARLRGLLTRLLTDHAPSFGPRQAANALWALPKLRLAPGAPADAATSALLSASLSGLRSNSPQELAHSLHGLAHLGLDPPAGWLSAHRAACEARGWGAFTGQDLATMLVRACVRACACARACVMH
jgi:hypothetical protein